MAFAERNKIIRKRGRKNVTGGITSKHVADRCSHGDSLRWSPRESTFWLVLWRGKLTCAPTQSKIRSARSLVALVAGVHLAALTLPGGLYKHNHRGLRLSLATPRLCRTPRQLNATLSRRRLKVADLRENHCWVSVRSFSKVVGVGRRRVDIRKSCVHPASRDDRASFLRERSLHRFGRLFF